MKAVVIRFINSADFIGRAINWATNSRWKHVEVAFKEDGKFVTGWIGAHDKGGVQDRPLDYCKPANDRQYELELTDAQYAKMRASAAKKIGTPYNFKDILGLLVHDRKLNSDGLLICSQTTIEICADGEVYLLNVEAGYEYLITPRDVHLSPLLRGKLIYSYDAGSGA